MLSHSLLKATDEIHIATITARRSIIKPEGTSSVVNVGGETTLVKYRIYTSC